MREVQKEHESKPVLDIFTAIFSEIMGQGETRPRKVTQNERKKGKKARHDPRNNVEMVTETTTSTGMDRETLLVGVRWSVSSDLLRCNIPWLFSQLLNPLPPSHQRYNPTERLIITLNRQSPLLTVLRNIITRMTDYTQI